MHMRSDALSPYPFPKPCTYRFTTPMLGLWKTRKAQRMTDFRTAWKFRAAAALADLAASGRPFDSDDLLKIVGHPDENHAANGRNNAIGSVFREASTAGLIVPVGTRQSTQPRRKGGLVRLWQGRPA